MAAEIKTVRVGFGFIPGMCVGIELADVEELKIPDMSWGVSIDLLILRISIAAYTTRIG